MSSAPNPLWTLLAVVVGGILATVGQVAAEWIRSSREAKNQRREQLMEQLYVVQDEAVKAFESVSSDIRKLRDPSEAAFSVLYDPDKFNDSVPRIETYTVRVGDDPLSKQVHSMLSALQAAAVAGAKGEAKLQEARGHLSKVQYRVGQLLHTGIEVDLGIEQRGSRGRLQRIIKSRR